MLKQIPNKRLSKAEEILLKRLSKKKLIPQRENGTNHLPLSYAQQRLWFIDQLGEGDSPSYNIILSWSVVGNLNKDVLKKAINIIVERHESLRTTFHLKDGKSEQIIHSKINIDIPLIDLSGYDEQDDIVKNFSKNEANTPFNLSVGPLIRVHLLKLNNKKHVLLINIHHIISDGWSIGNFNKELETLYESIIREIPPQLPNLPIQYGDYTLWQRDSMQKNLFDKQLCYWKDKLKGEIPYLNLPKDNITSTTDNFNGGIEKINIPQHMTKSLKELSSTEGVTLYMTLLAAYNILLYKYTNEEDIIIGSPIANRNYGEIENLIGFFVNTIVLRNSLKENHTFTEFLSSVEKSALEAYSNQDIPFEKIVEEINPDRTTDNPIFQVMFALQNASMPSLKLYNLELEEIPVFNDGAKFEVFLSITEDEKGLNCILEYNKDLFTSHRIKKMLKHFYTLLENILLNPEERILSLSIIDDNEQKQLLSMGIKEAPLINDNPVHKLFEKQVMCTPNETALVFEHCLITYKDLNEKANHIAYNLKSMDVQEGDLVGIYMERSTDLIASIIGILKVGAAYVPLDPFYPSDRLNNMIQDSGLVLILTQGDIDSEIVFTKTVNVMDIAECKDKCRNLNLEISNRALAYVLYTSGSTGKPKGVQMTHKALTNLINWQNKTTSHQHLRTLQFTSISFDVSFQEIFSTLSSGGTLFLISEEKRRHPEELLTFTIENKIERLFLPYVALKELAITSFRKSEYPIDLKEVVTAGEQLKISKEIREFFKSCKNAILRNQYGPTESHVVSEYILSNKQEIWPELPFIGKPIDNVKLYILDKELRPVPIGIPGELYVGGKCLSNGYINNQQLTNEKFIQRSISKQPKTLLYKTGDIVAFQDTGDIQYIGRNDNQVKIKGYRVELLEIESIINKYPNVKESILLMDKGLNNKNQTLKSFIVIEKNTPFSKGKLMDYLTKLLPNYMVPSSIVLLDEMPLTPNGKIDKLALLNKSEEQSLIETKSTCTSLERRMKKIWCNILKVDNLNINDNFFNVGGESLSAVTLISAVREEFKLNLPLKILFKYPTISKLCNVLSNELDEIKRDNEKLIVLKEGSRSLPPLVLLHPMDGGLFCYQDLIKELNISNKILGFEAFGYDSKEEKTLSNIKLMAEKYVQELKEKFPNGPYNLIGWSFGGTIAFEMNNILEKMSGITNRVILIDAPVLEKNKNYEYKVDSQVSPTVEYAVDILGLDANNLTGNKEQDLNYIINESIRLNILPKVYDFKMIQNHINLMLSHKKAILNYSFTNPIKSDINLFYATTNNTNTNFQVSEKDWSIRTEGQVFSSGVAGNHLSIVKNPYVKDLAEKIKNILI
ncbi:amino acid adenylation domain-containing protein [Priestia megaterium]|uniref:amino acid adenylation domain-containing protein n=1 Tax=Priestia megaterium TaxID=1404 RepID=UPI0025AF110F|nr:amino acid adenylation domain-containing protein [Priestia megaterium]MDN3362652.1 amino acid adenylation domain-containing protein [Priestia megaterium]